MDQMRSRRDFLQSASLCGAALMTPHHFPITESKIKVAQIGTTHPHAAGKLSAIRNLNETFEVVGVVEEDDQRWNAIKNKDSYKGLPRITEQQVFDDSSVQFVAVESAVKELVPTAIRCLNAGKHIHLDKPAGESMKACKAMHAEADDRKLTIQMGYMLRYNPAFQLLFQIVKDGWLGEITELNAAMGKKASASLRRELSQFKGGGMFELACHLIDAMVTVLGKPDKISTHNRKTQADKDNFLDNQLAIFDFPTAIATIRCNHVDPFGFARRHFDVVGETGNFAINPLEPPKAKLSLDRDRGKFKKGTQAISLPKTTGRYDDEFRDMAKVIRAEKQLAWNSEHDLIVHECVLLGSGVGLDD